MVEMTEQPPHPSALSRDVVCHIAALARLELNEAEIALFQKQLSAVLAHFQKISEVDTHKLPKSTRPSVTPDQLRPDLASPPLAIEQVLANAPEQQDDQFRVPAVLPENE
ncbi:MAG: Asp-tRNA(Asn)/Glu-tRNA(Gln) amidotransferase subunit GatC [Chloroflexi bacterium]|nr:Asp-tRNA(Asn)/Glu-tRNA(Gln) amidotransferase subunit GatC [Chloroflexota bacterium]